MAEPLSPLKKKIRPLLTCSFRNGVFTSVFFFLFGMVWRAGHIEAPGAGDAEKQKQEIEEQRARVKKIDDTAQKLANLARLADELWNARRSADWAKDYAEGPKISITYDMKWLNEKQDALKKELKEASLQAEIALIHSAHISERDFILLSREFANSGAAKQLTWMYREKLESDYPMTHINGFHQCQKEVAAKTGAAQTEQTAAAIIACTDDSIDWRMVAQRTGIGGGICLGFMGRRLRKKWDKALAEQQAAGAPPAPYNGPVIVTTAQPVTMKPIKIVKKTATA